MMPPQRRSAEGRERNAASSKLPASFKLPALEPPQAHLSSVLSNRCPLELSSETVL
ncbi:MAG: hypothetical protein LBD06_13340 [Candidatus Accumulibacter sp.]|nr:hypothetical protein [Accumulibacter sp.]